MEADRMTLLVNHVNYVTFLLGVVMLFTYLLTQAAIYKFIGDLYDPKTKFVRMLKRGRRPLSIIAGIIISITFFRLATHIIAFTLLLNNF